MKIEMKVKEYQFGDETYDFNLEIKYNQETGECMVVRLTDKDTGKTIGETTLNEKVTSQLSWIIDSLSEEAEAAKAWKPSTK